MPYVVRLCVICMVNGNESWSCPGYTHLASRYQNAKTNTAGRETLGRWKIPWYYLNRGMVCQWLFSPCWWMFACCWGRFTWYIEYGYCLWHQSVLPQWLDLAGNRKLPGIIPSLWRLRRSILLDLECSRKHRFLAHFPESCWEGLTPDSLLCGRISLPQSGPPVLSDKREIEFPHFLP